jgi:hypothetical protein
MSDNLLMRKRVLAFKVEGTAGTAESLTTAEAAFNVYNAEMTPTIEAIQRDSQSTGAPMSAQFGPYLGTCTWRTHLFSSASLPAYTAFFAACGWPVATRTFSPVTAPPGTSGVKTATIGLYENGRRKVLRGAMGSFVITLEAGRPCYIDWSFTGVWVTPPTDVTLLAPTYPAETPLRFANSGFGIGSWTPSISRMTIDAGNVLYPCEDANSADQSGIKYVIATSRRINGTIDPLAELVATNNTYGDWLSITEAAMDIDLLPGTNSGILIDATKFQVVGVRAAERNGLIVDEVEYQINASTLGADGEMTIEYDTT